MHNVEINGDYLHLFLENPSKLSYAPLKKAVCVMRVIMLLTDSLLANTHGVLFQFLLKAAQFPSKELV